MLFSTKIEKLPYTSILTIRRFQSLDIKTFWDLLNYFPFRYEDYSSVLPINQISTDKKITVKGQVINTKNEFSRRGLKIQKVLLSDNGGKIELWWYNQLYLAKIIHNAAFLSVSGRAKNIGSLKIFEPEQYEILPNLQSQTIHTAKIIPVYSETNGLSSRTIREKIFFLLRKTNLELNLKEILPEDILKRFNLLDELSAYLNIHFPKNFPLLKLAKNRLAFDEIFTIQLSSQLIKRKWQKEKVGHQFIIGKKNLDFLEDFINDLPFKLTNAQNKCLKQIINDLSQKNPMNRLLQGDVGSGKTVLAAMAAYLAFLNKFKTLLLSPTEILANQHYKTFRRLYQKNKNYNNLPKLALYTSFSKPKKQELEEADIIIGTHAIIEKKADFSRIGLTVVDEQHKFGVAQRAELKKKGINPHLLTMTATPIPRTVALTLYGELDLSIIDEMPKGRMTIKTYLVPQAKRNAAYSWIKKQITEKGSQVFIVCPLIEESQKETFMSVKAAKGEFEHLKNNVFSEFKLGLLHGRMKSKEKEDIMQKFAQNKIDILVSTPVVEVGIDVANAAIILIEGAERFGLAQLHQLRGRVGRGEKQSFCLLFTEKYNENSWRLKIFCKTNSGFKLSEQDLKIRGVGDIYGTKQHGALELKIADFSDFALIENCSLSVNYFLNKYNISDFPTLQKRIESYKISHITRD